MAKSGGLGQRLFVGGADISTDVQDLSDTGGGYTPLMSTDITKLAAAREIGGKKDARGQWNVFFNDAAAQAHVRLSTLPTSDVLLSWLMNVTALGAASFNMNAKQIDYNPNRDAEGALLFAISAQANSYGGEWGKTLTLGKRTDTGATTGTGVDFTAATAFGLTAYLHVVSFTGTDATIKIQESSDNGVGDAWADVVGGGFTVVTGGAPLAQRIETTRTLSVERYLRVTTTTSAGFSNLQFVVSACKPDVATVF
jgi:hypothetical protein